MTLWRNRNDPMIVKERMVGGKRYSVRGFGRIGGANRMRSRSRKFWSVVVWDSDPIWHENPVSPIMGVD